MTRRGLPIGPPPPPEELVDLPLEQAATEPQFLRPKKRTRVRVRRRGVAHAAIVTLQVLAVSLLLVVAGWMGWQRLYASEWLRVRNLEVRGSRFLSEGEVRELVGPVEGECLLGLDIEALTDRLRAFPWVESAAVTRALPDTLRVEIRERTPLALAELDRLYLMDGDGGLIDIYGPRTGAFDLPIVRGLLGVDEGSRRERARRAGLLLSDLADLGGVVSEVYVLDSGDLRVVLRGAGEVLLFGDPPYHERLVSFLGLRKDLVERAPDAEHFDLRYRDRIYAKRPAGAAPPAQQTASSARPAPPVAPAQPASALVARPSPRPVRPQPTPAPQRVSPPSDGSDPLLHTTSPAATSPALVASTPGAASRTLMAARDEAGGGSQLHLLDVEPSGSDRVTRGARSSHPPE